MQLHHHGGSAYTDDSGIGIDDLDGDYGADSSGYSPDTDTSGGGGSRLVGGAGYEQQQQQHVQQMAGHHLHSGQRMSGQQMSAQQQQQQQHMMQQAGHRPAYGLQQRVSSLSDMGIGSIINRGGN